MASQIRPCELTKLVILSVLCGLCVAQNNTVSDNGGSETTEEKSAIDKGMEPLYIMTNTFLDLVHPSSKAPFNTVLNISASNIVDGLKKFKVEYFSENWKDFTTHYIGFTICIAVGILYIIVMPIVGCCFCLCRCCGKCGAKSHKNPEKGSQRYKRVCCGIFLLLFNTLMLAGMVCAFVTNELLREQTSQSQQGVLSKTQANIRGLENYKNSVLQELNAEAVVNLRIKLDKIVQDLEDAPLKARLNISKLINADDVINNAESLVTSVLSINQSLTQVQDLTNKLKGNMASLDTSLNSAKTAALASLDKPECSVQQCTDLKSQINQLVVNPDYNQTLNYTVQAIDRQLSSIQATLNNNLKGLVDQGKYEFDEISQMVLNDTQKQIEDDLQKILPEIRQKKEEVLRDVKKQIEDISKQINELLPLNGTSAQIETVKKDTENYGNYRYYGGIGLASILLLIILLYYLGLCFGACGEAPGDDASCCNRGIGATVLMVGVAFTFLFCWLLMLVTMLIFIAGGFTYAEACRPLVNLDNNTLQLVQPILDENKMNFSIEMIIRDCKGNKGVYNAFQLGQYINLADVLDIDKYDVKAKLDELVANIDVSGLDNVEVISAETEARLLELKSADLDGINFQSYKDQLAKAIVSPNLTPIIEDLNTLAGVVNEPYKSEIAGHADTLQSLNDGIIATMKSDANKLQAALNTLENEFSKAKGNVTFSNKVDNLILSLKTLQTDIQTKGREMVINFVRDYGDSVYADMKDYISGRRVYVENNIGRCRPLYDLLTDTIDIACVDFLHPFNGFWFSIGWCVFFFIPSIIFAVSLVSLYRRTDEYDDADYRSFDEA